jgi:hypothetical protein
MGLIIKTHNATNAYTYSKVFMANPVTGKCLDTLDIANYYFNLTGSYTSQLFTDTANAAGYASTYDVQFSENKNMFTQSMYSWVIEKWVHKGTLPTVSINSVERVSNAVPELWSLDQNYPNPFNPSTHFKFTVGSQQLVTLTVFDALGREVSTIVNEMMQPGTYTATWNALPFTSGVYFYRLQAGTFSETKRMILMK